MLEENNYFDINENEEQSDQQEIKDFSEFFKNIEKKTEKKRDIRKLGTIIGVPAIFISAIGYIWSFVYIFLTTKVAGMTLKQAITFSENPAIQQILQIVLSCLMFLLPFSIAAKCAGVRIDQTILFEKAKKGTFLPFLLFGIGFCSFSNIAINYAQGIFESFGIDDYNVDFGDNPTGFFGFLLSFIATAIVPALVEEFACRGIILGLLKKHGEIFAIITSSVVFGIMHGNFEQIPFAVFVGLILGYIYVKTNSIWPCVAIHCVNNAISVIFSYLQNVMSTNIQNVLYIAYLVISLLAAVVGILLFAKRGNENYNLEKNEDIIRKKEKYSCFFTSWAIILFMIINILESVSYFAFFKQIVASITRSVG